MPSLPLRVSSLQLSSASQALAVYEFTSAQRRVVDLSLSFLEVSSIFLLVLSFSWLLFQLLYLSHAF